jgi:hypothetical protein
MKAEMVLTRAGEMISAGRVFGAPIEREGVTLVPVAWSSAAGAAARAGPLGRRATEPGSA